MRKVLIMIAIVALFVSAPSFAELQNVEVGGSIRIRGNYWTSPFGPDEGPLAGLRWARQPGRLAVTSPLDWDERGNSIKFVEQRTKVNVSADFTDGVSAFIELDSYNIWGTNFRSDYVTGIDGRPAAADVQVYQAYIEAREMWGLPLSVRIGRQEIKLGSGWLMGTNDAGSFFTGLSFDGIRATYAVDAFTIDAIYAKLVETSPAEEDGDIDLYGIYGSYLGLDNMTIDAYWLMIRDARSMDVTPGRDLLEGILGVDEYDVTYFNTIGLRANGKYNAFDYEAEIAYQFGNAGSVGRTFAGAGVFSPYGDDSADFGAWGANLNVGYTFDAGMNPRAFVGAAYYGGEDNRDVNVLEWAGSLVNPLWKPEASVSFNRMFSDWQYGQFVSSPSHDCTNLWVAYTGATISVSEKLMLTLCAAYVESLEDYDAPWPSFKLLNRRYAPLGVLSFLDRENDDDLCFEIDLTAVYNYSEDVAIEFGYSHLFLGDGAAQGSFNIANGLMFEGGLDDDDTDYFYFDTKIKF